MTQGYGTIHKKVMKDKDLSIEAKAIYAYLQSYAGAGDTAYPSVSLMSKDLNISERRFYNHRKTLIDKGYILIKQTRNDKRSEEHTSELQSRGHLVCRHLLE